MEKYNCYQKTFLTCYSQLDLSIYMNSFLVLLTHLDLPAFRLLQTWPSHRYGNHYYQKSFHKHILLNI